AEIAADPVADDRDVEDVRDAMQLPNLIRGEKLRFVDENAGETVVRLRCDLSIEAGALVERQRLPPEAEPRGHDPDAVPMVERRGVEPHRTPVLLVVMRDL